MSLGIPPGRALRSPSELRALVRAIRDAPNAEMERHWIEWKAAEKLRAKSCLVDIALHVRSTTNQIPDALPGSPQDLERSKEAPSAFSSDQSSNQTLTSHLPICARWFLGVYLLDRKTRPVLQSAIIQCAILPRPQPDRAIRPSRYCAVSASRICGAC